MQTSTNPARVIQTTTGRSFQIRTASATDWARELPTDRCGDILVSEAPGSTEGSIYAYWLGDKTLNSEGVLPAIEAHIADHDVVGVRVIPAFPEDAHSSLKDDLAELKQRAAKAKLLTVREGFRVRVKSEQSRIGGAKYPGREGIVQRENGTAGDYWIVRLAATARAQERSELFSVDELEVLTTVDDLPALPPLSGKEFAAQLDNAGTLSFANVLYSLMPHQVEGLKEGWAVNAAYPDGSDRKSVV